MPQYHLSGLWRFPVKSLRGEKLGELPVTETGFAHDRHWMVTDLNGNFLTQREQPRMVLIHPRIHDGKLTLTAAGMPDLPVQAQHHDEIPVTVWADSLPAIAVDPAADRWLTDFLGVACRLVEFSPTESRQVDRDFAQQGDQVGFADGFPFLLISQASLDDLNSRMDTTLPMERFRPNLVVSGCEPYEEDRWRRIRIGNISFRVVKPCSRCTIPTVDPETGQRDGKEPLATLATYRRQNNKVFFGQNLIHDGTGELKQDAEVEILEWA
ncbi:MAG: MOSC domain-containing protein [bacterium]